MGPTLDDVARSLSRSMPVGGICVTAERDRLPVLEREAARHHCELVVVDPESVSDEDLARFTTITFKENVAIALAVADLLNVNRQSAGMWAVPPDPGALSVINYRSGDKRISLANIFAANDPESTLMNLERLFDQGIIARPLHLVIDCRPDRVERNQQMGALVERIDPDRVILIGEPTRSAASTINPHWQNRVLDLGGNRGEAELLDPIIAGIQHKAALVTIGNIHGQGEILLEAIDHLDRLPADAAPRPRPQPRRSTQPHIPGCAAPADR